MHVDPLLTSITSLLRVDLVTAERKTRTSEAIFEEDQGRYKEEVCGRPEVSLW
jgi:hypothetical protein